MWLFLTFFLLVASLGWGADVIIFGPKTYTRGAGKPVTVKETFRVAKPSGQYKLQVTNHGVTSAVIRLNGRTILQPKDFTFKDGRPWSDEEWERHTRGRDDDHHGSGADNDRRGRDDRERGRDRDREDRDRRDGNDRDDRRGHDGESPVPFLARNLTLRAGVNEIVVELRGKPGTSLSIGIVGESDATSDLTPPTITATASPAPNASGWNNTNVTVTFTCADNVAVRTCPAPVTVSTEGAGQTVSGTATDTSGNTATTSVTLNIDKSPPAVQLSAPADNSTTQTPVASVRGSIPVGASPVTSATCNGVPSAFDATTRAFACEVPLQIGANAIVVTATDTAGNVGSSTLRVNYQPLSPTITGTVTPAPNAAGWNRTNVTVTFTCTQASVCQPPILVSTEGANQVVTGTATGPGGAVTTQVSVNIDKSAPVVTITSPVDGSTTPSSQISVVATFSAGGSPPVSATCNGVAAVVSGLTATCASVPLAEGLNTVTVSAIDAAGNLGSVSTGVTRLAAPPTINATATPAPNAAGWNRTDVRVTFTCFNATSCPAPIDVTTEGANQTITGTATGPGGSALASITLNVDKTPPRISIAKPVSGAGLLTANVTVAGNLADDLSGVAGANCTTVTATISGGSFSCDVALSAGANVLSATATDVAGNTASAAPVNVSYTRIPGIRITSPANLAYLSISPTTVTGTVDDPTATVTINSIPAVVSNGLFSIALPIAEGPNIISATATTPAGAAGTASIEVNLDTTPPRVTINSPPDQFETTDAAITVSGIVNDIVVGTVNDQQAQVKVNGADAQVANRMFVANAIPLVIGPNVIQAVGRDRVGNAATTQITVVRKAVTAQAQIRLISGNNQTAPINSAVAAPLLIGVTDASGAPVPNKPVIFKVTQNSGLVTAGAAPAPTVIATTNAQGQAQVQWTLGGRAGAGGNTVEAYVVGFEGTAIFTATGTQGPAGKIVVDTGGNQIGAIGQPLPKPFIAVVVDSGNNRVGGVPVTFSVGQGGGSFDGKQTYEAVTDSDGRAAATLTLGLQEGEANNLVSATFPQNQGFPAAFTASGRAPGDPSKTTISGVVLDNSNAPIPGVTIRAVLTNVMNSNANATQIAQSTQTNAQGQFSIAQAPVGLVKLIVDGSTAQRPGTYPSLEYDMVTVAGQANTVGQPIFLLALNTANQLCVSDTIGGGTLTIPEAPGFSLTFGPGQVTFPGGSKTGCITVSVVNADKVPMAPGFGQQPRFIVTIQPAGAVFNPPAPITLPNVDGLKPRAVTEMYSFDHDISSFVAIGTGTVSNDGLVIRSNTGVGVLKAGWHCGGDPNTVGTYADCGDCKSCVSTPAYPNGECKPDPGQEGKTCIPDGTPGICDGPPVVSPSPSQPPVTTEELLGTDFGINRNFGAVPQLSCKAVCVAGQKKFVLDGDIVPSPSWQVVAFTQMYIPGCGTQAQDRTASNIAETKVHEEKHARFNIAVINNAKKDIGKIYDNSDACLLAHADLIKRLAKALADNAIRQDQHLDHAGDPKREAFCFVPPGGIQNKDGITMERLNGTW